MSTEKKYKSAEERLVECGLFHAMMYQMQNCFPEVCVCVFVGSLLSLSLSLSFFLSLSLLLRLVARAVPVHIEYCGG